METKPQKCFVMAFIVSVVRKNAAVPKDVDGFVMFVNEEFARVIALNGRDVCDFFGIEQQLNAERRYPGFMTWEGEVTYSTDGVPAIGQWRRSTVPEIIAASKGRNPFEKGNEANA